MASNELEEVDGTHDGLTIDAEAMLGQPPKNKWAWEEFFNSALAPTEAEGQVENNRPSSSSTQTIGVATLPCKKAPCYGLCPTEETEHLKLVRCEECGLVTTLLGFTHHLRWRHGRQTASDSDSECADHDDEEQQDCPLSPPHLPALASTSSNSLELPFDEENAVMGDPAAFDNLDSSAYYVEKRENLVLVLSKRLNSTAHAGNRKREEIANQATTRVGNKRCLSRGSLAKGKRKPPGVDLMKGSRVPRRESVSSQAEEEENSARLLTVEENDKKRKRKVPEIASSIAAPTVATANRGKKRPRNRNPSSTELTVSPTKTEFHRQNDTGSPEMMAIAKLLSFPGLSVTAMLPDGHRSPIKAQGFFATSSFSPVEAVKQQVPKRKPHTSKAPTADVKEEPGVVGCHENRLLRELKSRKAQLLNRALVAEIANSPSRTLPVPVPVGAPSSSQAAPKKESRGIIRRLRRDQQRIGQLPTISRGQPEEEAKAGCELSALHAGPNARTEYFVFPEVQLSAGAYNMPDFVRQQVHLETALSSSKAHSTVHGRSNLGSARQQHAVQQPRGASTLRRDVEEKVGAPCHMQQQGHSTAMIGGTRFVAVESADALPESERGTFTLFAPALPPAQKLGIHEEGYEESGRKVTSPPRRRRPQPIAAGSHEGALKSCLKKSSKFIAEGGAGPYSNSGGTTRGPSSARSFLLNGSISVDENGIHRLPNFSSVPVEPAIFYGSPDGEQPISDDRARRIDYMQQPVTNNIHHRLQSRSRAPKGQGTNSLAPAGMVPPTELARLLADTGGRAQGGTKRQHSQQQGVRPPQPQNHPPLTKYRPIMPRQRMATLAPQAQSTQLTMMLVSPELCGSQSQQACFPAINSTRTPKRVTPAASLITVGPGDPIPIPLSTRNSPSGSDASGSTSETGGGGRRSTNSQGNPHLVPMIPPLVAAPAPTSFALPAQLDQRSYYLSSPPPPLQFYQPTSVSLEQQRPQQHGLVTYAQTTAMQASTQPRPEMMGNFAFVELGTSPTTTSLQGRPGTGPTRLPPILQRHSRASHNPPPAPSSSSHSQTADPSPPKLYANLANPDSGGMMSPVLGESWRNIDGGKKSAGSQANARQPEAATFLGFSPPPGGGCMSLHQFGQQQRQSSVQPTSLHYNVADFGLETTQSSGFSLVGSGWPNSLGTDFVLDAPPVLEAQVPVRTHHQTPPQLMAQLPIITSQPTSSSLMASPPAELQLGSNSAQQQQQFPRISAASYEGHRPITRPPILQHPEGRSHRSALVSAPNCGTIAPVGRQHHSAGGGHQGHY